MLEEKDFQAIATLLDERFKKSEERMTGIMDRRFQESEARMDEKLRESEVRTDRRFREFKYHMTKEMRKQIGKSTTRILNEVDRRIVRSEEFMLCEMERYDKKNERRFDELNAKMEAYDILYRVTNTETETINILNQSVNSLDERLTVVEKKVGVA